MNYILKLLSIITITTQEVGLSLSIPQTKKQVTKNINESKIRLNPNTNLITIKSIVDNDKTNSDHEFINHAPLFNDKPLVQGYPLKYFNYPLNGKLRLTMPCYCNIIIK